MGEEDTALGVDRPNCPGSLFNIGFKISGQALASCLCCRLAHCIWHTGGWGGGDTSILDKVCFPRSGLLMPLSESRSKKGLMTHPTVKTFFRSRPRHRSPPPPPHDCQSESRSLNFRSSLHEVSTSRIYYI